MLMVNSNPVVVNRTTRFSCTKARTYHSLGRRNVRIILLGSGPTAVVASGSVTSEICVRPLAMRMMRRLVLGRGPSDILPALNNRTKLGLTVRLSRGNFLGRRGVELVNAATRAVGGTRSHRRFGSAVRGVNRPVTTSGIIAAMRSNLTFAGAVNCPMILHPTCALNKDNNNVTRGRCRLHRVLRGNLHLSHMNRILMRHYVTK